MRERENKTRSSERCLLNLIHFLCITVHNYTYSNKLNTATYILDFLSSEKLTKKHTLNKIGGKYTYIGIYIHIDIFIDIEIKKCEFVIPCNLEVGSNEGRVSSEVRILGG